MTKQKDYSPLLGDPTKQFITAGHPPQLRHIVAAANRDPNTGTILVGARHWSKAMCLQCDMMRTPSSHFSEQGFIDQYDQFVSREEAKEIVVKNGQKLAMPAVTWDVLYSENLY